MLYDICSQEGIPVKKLGKLVVATSEEENENINTLYKRGRDNGVEDLAILSRREVSIIEPNIKCTKALICPSTGIIDSHQLMRYYISKLQNGKGHIVYRSQVTHINQVNNAYKVTIKDGMGESSVTTRILINSAGLLADKIANLVGIDICQSGYKLHYCKGEYFSVNSARKNLVRHLIYPVPPPDIAGTGIHLIFDLDGGMRLGPGIEYVDGLDYSVNPNHKKLFWESAHRFLPALDFDDLEPEMVGIRPKLQRPGEGIHDFIITDESARGFPGFINLIGIESPGLTSSPSISEYVSELVTKYF
jgi:L-2-hydroxyglutarate oxidase LhgO